MPKINVYLPDDLAEAVREAGLPVSAVCQRALEQAVRRVTGIREIAAGHDGDPLNGAAASELTARAMTALENAQAEAAVDGVQALDSGHLLRAMVSDRDSMAVRVLAALDITPRHVQTELDRQLATGRSVANTSARSAGRLSPEVATAVELATSESSGLGTSYVGTEHLLLGLIGEPDGVAGHVLRSLGADLRITRRIVAAALAGWGARAALAARHEDGASSQTDQLTAVVRAELAPVLARVERLESLVAG
jgi:ATP-dependent Clp protease ATP-binding subunit ClpA